MPEYTNPPGSDSYASFIGWQETLSGKSFPLFNITIVDHPLYRSTVSDATLRRLLLRVPRTLSAYHENIVVPAVPRIKKLHSAGVINDF